MTADELLEFFRIEKLLTLINKAIMNLPQEELQEAMEMQAEWMERNRQAKKQSQFQIQHVSQLIMDNHGSISNI
jgi:hypothetical protein